MTGIVVQGNYIGTDVTGRWRSGTEFTGSATTPSATTFSTTLSPRPTETRCWIDSGSPTDGARVQGNRIGTDASGLLPIPNTGWGVRAIAGGLQIGGTGEGEGNVIAYNGTGFSGGILIEGGQSGKYDPRKLDSRQRGSRDRPVPGRSERPTTKATATRARTTSRTSRSSWVCRPASSGEKSRLPGAFTPPLRRRTTSTSTPTTPVCVSRRTSSKAGRISVRTPSRPTARERDRLRRSWRRALRASASA